MKVFWSWQSDSPGKTGRHFIREALEDAIEELKTAKDTLDESERPESEELPQAEKLPETDELHLDHDRKYLLGSPDLFQEIHSKIKKSTVFVCDITPIAVRPDGRKAMNPNVAIELGIALESVGTNSVLLIMNKAHGDRDSMPFDLAHKSGPIMYELPDGASNAQIKTERKKLAAVLKDYIGPYIEAAKPKPTPFDVGSDWQNRSTFVDGDQMIIVDTGMGGLPKKVKLRTDGRLFLRVFPKLSIPKLTVNQLQSAATGGALHVLYFDRAGDWGRAADGFVIHALMRTDGPCPDYVKVLETGEVWAVLHYDSLIEEGPTKAIPLQFLVNRLARRLTEYSDFLSTRMNYKGDLGFIAGITEIKDKQVAGLKYESIPVIMGQGMLSQVVVRGEKTAKQTAVEALQPFVTEVWQAFGLPQYPVVPH